MKTKILCVKRDLRRSLARCAFPGKRHEKDFSITFIMGALKILAFLSLLSVNPLKFHLIYVIK